MHILITPDNGYVHISGSAPEEGKTYLLEDAMTKKRYADNPRKEKE